MLRKKLGGYAKEWALKSRKGKQEDVAGNSEFRVHKHTSPMKILRMHKGTWVDIENVSQENEGGKPQKEWPQTRTVLCHRQ